jgi:hypothetical protein
VNPYIGGTTEVYGSATPKDLEYLLTYAYFDLDLDPEA